MDYDAIVTQALTLLQREQRLAYRVLKLRLQIDDDLLEVLKDDLIYAKKLAVDEDGRVLVWMGGMSSAAPTASPMPSPATPDISPTQSETAPIAPPTPEAERRQLTVMFCDLVDSTRLSSQLDPEDWRDVVREYQRVCTDVIQRYDGYIAQLLGDGLLVYLGYPHAHEDDAQRAVRGGLGMLAAMGDLNSRLHQAKGLQLGVRLGIHTGLVVIGEMGSAGRQEQLALGDVPNIASRIEGLAAPNTVAISEATYRLVQGYFVCQDLGAQSLRGVTEAMRIYHVLGESGATSRLDVAQPRGLTPLVGRESEVTLLQERWQQAKSGQGQVVLLTGDAGIGKSRLVQMLKDHVANEPHVRWECRSAEYAQNTVLFPLTDLFQRILQWQSDETPGAKLAKLEYALGQYRLPLEESVPLFAPLLALPVPEQHYAPLHLSRQRQRQKTLETIVAILLELAEHQPVLFIVEDLHWTDPTTLEWLNLLIDQIPTTSILMLLTCRPHFQPAWHHRSYITEMTLNHLSHAQVAQIVHGMTEGTTLPPEVLQQILAKTDGVPLFVEEITKAILESGQLTAVDGHYELAGSLSTLAIPATLQDSLMARLDRLVTAKAVAQMGATIGRQFAYDLLQAVSQLDAVTLQRELGKLVEAEIVFLRGVPPQATYIFKHALIQDAAYESLLKSTRQQYHQRIAQVLVAHFPDMVETQPELVAQHYTEAGLAEEAVAYWQQAGERSNKRSAYVEAVVHFTKGLEVLQALPDTPTRAQHELDVQITLCQALTNTKGYAAPEVKHTYDRARELCQQVGDTRQLFTVLQGLRGVSVNRGEYQTARELGEECLTLAQRQQDPMLLRRAYYSLGNTLQFLGELAPARTHLEQALALSTPQQDHTLTQQTLFRVPCLAYTAYTLWRLGYPDQALTRSHEMLSLAQESSHAYSLARALFYAASLHGCRREWSTAQERAEAALALSTEQGFAHWVGYAMMGRGQALGAQGWGKEGIAQMQQGLAVLRATGAEIRPDHRFSCLAEAYGGIGQVEEGLRLLAEALVAMDNTGERRDEAELYRIKGVLLLRQTIPDMPQAEACFQQALAIARRQQAKSWELRVATSLSRLWQGQGKQAEARELLAPVYDWFTEGFDTADLQEAKALLDELT